MKKIISIISIFICLSILLCACGDKKSNKATANKNNNKKVSAEKKEKKTTKKEKKEETEKVQEGKDQKKSEKTTEQKATKKASTTKKATEKKEQTTNKTTTQTTKPQPPLLTVESPTMTYGYKNAWGTTSQMIADFKSSVESRGYTYYNDITFSNMSGKITVESDDFNYDNQFKNYVFSVPNGIANDLKFYKFKILFVNTNNYTSLLPASCQSQAKNLLNNDDLKLVAYILFY